MEDQGQKNHLSGFETQYLQQVHHCRKCGWPFPKPQPSAKHRRAHKRVCGTLEGYTLQDSSQTIVSDDDHSDDGDFKTPQISFKKRLERSPSEDDFYSDAVSNFADASLKSGIRGSPEFGASAEGTPAGNLTSSVTVQAPMIAPTISDKPGKRPDSGEISSTIVAETQFDFPEGASNVHESDATAEFSLNDKVKVIEEISDSPDTAEPLLQVTDGVSTIADPNERCALTVETPDGKLVSETPQNDVSPEHFAVHLFHVPHDVPAVEHPEKFIEGFKDHPKKEDVRHDNFDLEVEHSPSVGEYNTVKEEELREVNVFVPVIVNQEKIIEGFKDYENMEDKIPAFLSSDYYVDERSIVEIHQPISDAVTGEEAIMKGSAEEEEVIGTVDTRRLNLDTEGDNTISAVEKLPRDVENGTKAIEEERFVGVHSRVGGDSSAAAEIGIVHVAENISVRKEDEVLAEKEQIKKGDEEFKGSNSSMNEVGHDLDKEAVLLQVGTVTQIPNSLIVVEEGGYEASLQVEDGNKQQLTASVLDSLSSRSESLDANWGSVSVVSTQSGTITPNDEPRKVGKPNTKQQQATAVGDKLETSIEDSSLVVEEEKKKDSSSVMEDNGAASSTVASILNSSTESKAAATAAAISDEWNSPARYPPTEINKDKKKVKGSRPYWAQFVCCSSGIK